MSAIEPKPESMFSTLRQIYTADAQSELAMIMDCRWNDLACLRKRMACQAMRDGIINREEWKELCDWAFGW